MRLSASEGPPGHCEARVTQQSGEATGEVVSHSRRLRELQGAHCPDEEALHQRVGEADVSDEEAAAEIQYGVDHHCPAQFRNVLVREL